VLTVERVGLLKTIVQREVAAVLTAIHHAVTSTRCRRIHRALTPMTSTRDHPQIHGPSAMPAWQWLMT